MEFQVISSKCRPRIRADLDLIAFHFRKEMEAVAMGIEECRTGTGALKIASTALTALDLLRYPHATSGINNAATIPPDTGQETGPGRLASLSEFVSVQLYTVSGKFSSISAMTTGRRRC